MLKHISNAKHPQQTTLETMNNERSKMIYCTNDKFKHLTAGKDSKELWKNEGIYYSGIHGTERRPTMSLKPTFLFLS